MKFFLDTSNLDEIHPLTDKGLEGFTKDWEKAREQLGDIFPLVAARKATR